MASDTGASCTKILTPGRSASWHRASRAFADQAPDGRYWRHAPVVKFSETPCEAGKPYCGLGEHTRAVLEELGYDEATIERLEAKKVIGLGRDQESSALAIS